MEGTGEGTDPECKKALPCQICKVRWQVSIFTPGRESCQFGAKPSSEKV